MIQKRYQYYSKDGTIKWSEWFEWPHEDFLPEWQLKNKLKNEYRTI